MKGRIRKRSKDSFSVVVTVGYDPKTRKPKQKWFTVKGKKSKAEEELRRILTELASGTLIDPSKCTVGEYLVRWLRERLSRSILMSI